MKAEQAQTVAEIRERSYNATTYGINDGQSVNDRATLLQIVDSQAAEIAAKAETIETNAKYTISIQSELMMSKIEIERLTQDRDTLTERLRHANEALAGIGIGGY